MSETRHEDFYRRLRTRISAFLATRDGAQHPWASILLVTPDIFYLLWNLVRDERVPKAQKAKLVGALVYFVSPIDLLPEAILGPIGYLDDVAVAAYALNSVINQIDPAIAREHWTGQEDALLTIQRILDQANQFLGGKLWGKLLKGFKRG